MRFEVYVPDHEDKVIEQLKKKGRSRYIVTLVKKDIIGEAITKEDVINLIRQYGATVNDDNKNESDLMSSINSVLGE